ncbi:hypothetical protein [Microvirga massiliensis]|uniref:hypothetical protein n=1 Tax=Microvirga massiliensis TaxID=1033741 RepID=UPI00062BB05B|nr:hypothetical protein [Microvirga massiliensis]
MSWATDYITKLLQGETVNFRPRGHSMVPLIQSGQLCTVEPLNDRLLSRGSIVLCKVRGTHYLHLVTAVRSDQVQISNNRGRMNGWTPSKNIFGILTQVQD